MSDPSFDYYAGRPHDHSYPHDERTAIGEPVGDPPSECEITSRAMQELLEEKGLITAEEVRRRMELFEEEFPYRGAKAIARAWTVPAWCSNRARC
jgi:hypothetical protein